MLVSAFAVSACAWVVFSLVVKALGCESVVLVGEFVVSVCELGTLVVPFSGLACELGMLISPFSALVCPFGTLVVPFAVSGLGWVVFSLAVRGLGCE